MSAEATSQGAKRRAGERSGEGYPSTWIGARGITPGKF